MAMNSNSTVVRTLPDAGLVDRGLLSMALGPDGIGTLFQPIFVLGDRGIRLHGLECLSRGPQGTSIEPVKELFDYARRHGALPVVDRACAATALRSARHLPPKVPLSINVHAETLRHDASFAEFLAKTAASVSIAPRRLTVEIVDHARGSETVRLLAGVERLRRAGVAVALDEIGHGLANYRLLLACRPSYFKLDRALVNGCASQPARLAVLRSLAAAGRKLGAQAVATGVESTTDLNALTGIGLRLVQGYLFSPPLPFARLLEVELVSACLYGWTPDEV